MRTNEKPNQTHKHREQTDGCRGERWGAVEMGEGSGSCRLLVMERMRGMEGTGRSATL